MTCKLYSPGLRVLDQSQSQRPIKVNQSALFFVPLGLSKQASLSRCSLCICRLHGEQIAEKALKNGKQFQ